MTSIADYEEVLADHRRLVCELDVLLNGAGAARQASLCDIVSQVERETIRSRHYRAECFPADLPHGMHDFHLGQCGRCGARSPGSATREHP